MKRRRETLAAFFGIRYKSRVLNFYRFHVASVSFYQSD